MEAAVAVEIESPKEMGMKMRIQMKSPWSSRRENVNVELDAPVQSVITDPATLRSSQIPVLAIVAKNAQLEQRQYKSARKVFPGLIEYLLLSAFVSMRAHSQHSKA